MTKNAEFEVVRPVVLDDEQDHRRMLSYGRNIFDQRGAALYPHPEDDTATPTIEAHYLQTPLDKIFYTHVSLRGTDAKHFPKKLIEARTKLEREPRTVPGFEGSSLQYNFFRFFDNHKVGESGDEKYHVSLDTITEVEDPETNTWNFLLRSEKSTEDVAILQKMSEIALELMLQGRPRSTRAGNPRNQLERSARHEYANSIVIGATDSECRDNREFFMQEVREHVLPFSVTLEPIVFNTRF